MIKSLLRKMRGRMDYQNERWFYEYYRYRLQASAQRKRYKELPAPQGNWPILLNISFPKSGTNLLSQVLTGFTKVAPFTDHSYVVFAVYEGPTGKKRTTQDALNYLDMLHPGDVATAHLAPDQPVVDRVCTPDYIPYFIFRDPRDVVVSHVFYVTGMAPSHVHHKYYANVLKTFDERLQTSILGLPNSEVEFPDIAKRFAVYTGWLDHPQVLTVHFEDFILNRRPTLEKVLDHFLKRVDNLPTPREKILDALEESIQPERSPTFRSGKTGEWKKHFNEENKKLFKEVAGPLLIRLGYEKGLDW